jgi:hypothetical protein
MGKRIDRRRKQKLGPENIAARKAGLVLTVDRREALIREIDTAIQLWFLRRDPLSILLIVMAAHKCLCDLGKKRGIGPVARTFVQDQMFTLAYDYLRHASSDLHDILDFPLRTNELILYDCVDGMKKIFGGSTVLMDTFALYFALHLYPEQPNIHKNATENLPQTIRVEEIEGLGMNDFLTKVMPLIAAAKSGCRELNRT